MEWSRFAYALIACAGLSMTAVHAQKRYDPGASDTEIKIGQTMPYSGPASAFGAFGKAQEAYLRMVNDAGGINGRRITFLSRDDGYSPPKTVEATRRLVESDEVLFTFGSAGTATNLAVRSYLNGKRVPQLFVGSGATQWGDPKNYPWTMGWAPSYSTEGQIYAKYILANVPSPKIAVLYQNDDFGKDLLAGLRAGLGEQASKLIVREASYEVTDPTVDSQIISLQDSGANVFLNASTPKVTAQAIRKASDMGWKPTQFVAFVSSSIGSVLTPAGLEKATGVLSIQFLKDYSDPRWANDPGMLEYVAFLKKYMPDGDPKDFLIAYGYAMAQTTVQVLKQCGDDLSRANVMRQAAALNDFTPPMLLPGIRIRTSPTNFFPIRQAQLSKFDGKSWQLIGKVLGD
jgi:branched-chain amino acid transport system substrate-binding protein